jgi:hypothetical protein
VSEHHDDADHGSNGAMAGDPMVGVIADVVTAFAPHVTPEMAASIATQVLLEQQGIARVIEDAIPTSENAQKFPVWGFRVITQDGKAGLVKAPKTLHGTAIGDVIQSISVFALLTSPPARAVLYSYGYRIEFVQAPGAQEQRIIMPGQ